MRNNTYYTTKFWDNLSNIANELLWSREFIEVFTTIDDIEDTAKVSLYENVLNYFEGSLNGADSLDVERLMVQALVKCMISVVPAFDLVDGFEDVISDMDIGEIAEWFEDRLQ